MAIMLKSARRKDGEEQPYIPLGLLKLRLPFIHWEWEFPEMVQAMVVFTTGAAATAYLEDLFGFTFTIALSIVVVHEGLYLVNNIFGDPLIGGWITPAVPLITTFLLNYEGKDRMFALVSIELTLGILYVVLGLTGLAGKLVDFCPLSIKAGILIGAGFAACIGQYGFKAVAAGGLGFFAKPWSWSIGVLLGLFLLFSQGFGRIKFTSKNKLVKLLAKAGFLPALIAAYVVGIAVGEIPLPNVSLSDGFIFNPIPGLQWVWENFSLIGIGLPPVQIWLSALPMAIIAYVIAFGDIVGGTAFIRDADAFRTDEKIDMNPNRTNVCCGIRNLIECLFSPTCTMSGPLWSAMTVSVAERYKTGKENMYSIFGGACTFNTTKVLCCLIVPLMALVQPVLPTSMAMTLMIQAFGSFYVALSMCRTNVERGVAGITGGAIAFCSNPAYGLAVGIALYVVVEFLGTNKPYRMKLQRDEIKKSTEAAMKELEAEQAALDAILEAKAAKANAKA